MKYYLTSKAVKVNKFTEKNFQDKLANAFEHDDKALIGSTSKEIMQNYAKKLTDPNNQSLQHPIFTVEIKATKKNKGINPISLQLSDHSTLEANEINLREVKFFEVLNSSLEHVKNIHEKYKIVDLREYDFSLEELPQKYEEVKEKAEAKSSINDISQEEEPSDNNDASPEATPEDSDESDENLNLSLAEYIENRRKNFKYPEQEKKSFRNNAFW